MNTAYWAKNVAVGQYRHGVEPDGDFTMISFMSQLSPVVLPLSPP
jgi:hypothetical protein